MSFNKPSVILMGSKPGSVVALSILLERNWEIRYVVITKEFHYPWISGKSLEQLAAENGIKVVSQQELPRDLTVDFVISYMFRHRVKPDVISMAKRAALNFHAGPLPEFGGWAFYNIAILEDSPFYGCTCHYMDDGFDTGPIFKVRRFPIDASQETAFSLEQKAQAEMIKLFMDFCQIAEKQKKLPIEEQDTSKMRYLNKQEFEKLKEIPQGANEETIDRYSRAFWYPPYECAYFKIGETKVEVIPNMVKGDIAGLLHASDLEDLMRIKADYNQEVFNVD